MLNFFGQWIRNRFWNDIIFKNRNQKYGAYQLRLHYARNMSKSFLWAILFFFILLWSPEIYSWYESIFFPHHETTYESLQVTMSSPPKGNQGMENIPLIEKKEKDISKKEQSKPSTQIPEKPKIVKSDPDPKPKKLETTNAPNTKLDSANTASSSHSAGSSNHSGDTTVIFKFVKQMPLFAGCDEEGLNYLQKKKCSEQKLLGFLKSNLKYPNQALKNKTEGIVLIQFIIEKNGSISNIEIKKDIGDGCGNEAKRVLELINSLRLYWTPGIQANSPVRVQYTLPVEFEGF